MSVYAPIFAPTSKNAAPVACSTLWIRVILLKSYMPMQLTRAATPVGRSARMTDRPIANSTGKRWKAQRNCQQTCRSIPRSGETLSHDEICSMVLANCIGLTSADLCYVSSTIPAKTVHGIVERLLSRRSFDQQARAASVCSSIHVSASVFLSAGVDILNDQQKTAA